VEEVESIEPNVSVSTTEPVVAREEITDKEQLPTTSAMVLNGSLMMFSSNSWRVSVLGLLFCRKSMCSGRWANAQFRSGWKGLLKELHC
jgi:hypothetical protein